MELLQNDSLHLRMSHFLLLVKEHERKLLHPRQRVQDSRPGDKNSHSLWSTLFCKILLFVTSLIPKDKSLLCDLQEVNSSCAICETRFLPTLRFCDAPLRPCAAQRGRRADAWILPGCTRRCVCSLAPCSRLRAPHASAFALVPAQRAFRALGPAHLSARE